MGLGQSKKLTPDAANLVKEHQESPAQLKSVAALKEEEEESLGGSPVLGPKPLIAQCGPQPKQASSGFVCKVCTINLASSSAMSVHLGSEWHRRAALARLFYFPMPRGEHQRRVYPREAVLRLAQSPLVLNAGPVELKVEAVRRAEVEQESHPAQVSAARLPLLTAPVAQKPENQQWPRGELVKKALGESAENRQPPVKAKPLVIEDTVKKQEKKEAKEKKQTKEMKEDLENRAPPASYAKAVDPRAKSPQPTPLIPMESSAQVKPASPQKKPPKAAVSKKTEELEEGEIEEVDPPVKPLWITDEAILARRQKDIDKGKDSAVYRRYVEAIPKAERIRGIHPRTPNKYQNVSRRSWDAQVRIWRRALHVWAGEGEAGPSGSPEPQPQPLLA